MKRLEGLDKLTGRERYVDDLPLEDALWAFTVRSPSPRGRITSVRFPRSIDWSEFVVVDHHALPGPNEVALVEKDQPILAATHTRHIHEPVAIVAHPNRETARAAARAVEVVVEDVPPVLDYRVDPIPELIQHGDDNLFAQQRIEKGDVDAALAHAAHVIEGTYETGAQEHVYLENQGMVAQLDGDVLTVHGSMQCPYYVHASLAHAFGWPDERIRVAHVATGGGFGGKEEYPSVLALHAALVAVQTDGRPVKLIYERGEDMAATTKRHPARLRHRTGLDADGRLVAQSIEVLMDGGAYVTLSSVVLSRGIIHAAGPYHCPNVRIDGRVRLTNAAPFGAFRGFGAPQTHFANERHLDVVAERIGLDPVELRRRNLIRDGDSTATGQVIRDGTDRIEVLDRAVRLASWPERRRAHADFNAAHPFLRRGIGLAAFHHGAGFTGSGEVHLASELEVAGRKDGRIEVRSANTEMGQGTTTIFTKIAAERLAVAPEEIVVAPADTSLVPNSGPTVASRTAMVVGRLIERACDGLRERAGAEPGVPIGDAIRAWHDRHPGEPLVCRVQYEKPPEIEWDDERYRGDAYAAFSWATYVADVEVDLRTGSIRVRDFVAVQEVGRVLHEVLARGQIQGGVVQGIGWALMEECRFERGAMINNQMTNYIIPTSDDVPPIRVAFMENPYANGGQGAKGIGELPIDGPAPAIANAVADALRAFRFDANVIPLTPESVLARWSRRVPDETPLIDVAMTLNGAPMRVEVDPRDRLLDVLRYRLGLTGTKEGCGEGECGACTVLLDGLPVNSCLVAAIQARGCRIETVESIPPDRLADLHASGATQCGACTPGVAVTARWVVDHPELRSRFTLRQLMAGNLCRCTGYDGIIDGLELTIRNASGDCEPAS